MGAHDAGIGEEDVQPAISSHGILDDRLHGSLVRGIELARVHFRVRIQTVDFTLVRLQVAAVKVTDVHGLGAVSRELMSCRAADAERRVGARDDDHFVLYAGLAGLRPYLLDQRETLEGIVRCLA